MIDGREDYIQRNTEKMLRRCMQLEGKTVEFTKEELGRNREAIFDRVRELLKLMAITYSVNNTFPMGKTDYGHVYKIKILTQAQIKERDELRKTPFGVKYGLAIRDWRKMV